MLKIALVIYAVLACVAASPRLKNALLAYNASADMVTATYPIKSVTSTPVVAGNGNSIATAPIVAPFGAPIDGKIFNLPAAAAFIFPFAAGTFSTPPVAAYTVPLAVAAYTVPMAASYTLRWHTRHF